MPAVVSGEPCEVAVRVVPGWLRAYVIGFSGFRSGSGRPIAHLLLPLASATVIVDFGSRSGLISGAREVATADGDTRWGHGVSLGLTPLGVATLFGVPMGEFGGGAVALAELLGPAATELPDMLGAAASWDERFDLLESALGAAFRRDAAVVGPRSQRELLDARQEAAAFGRSADVLGRSAGRLGRGADVLGQGAGRLERSADVLGRAAAFVSRSRRGAADLGARPGGKAAVLPDDAVMAAWWRLQRGDRPPIGAVADALGVSRRRLERGFREHIGMSPGAVGRIARFQRAVARFGAGATPAEAAAGSGLVDQSHLARETRALAGMTPAEFAAYLRTPPIVVSQTSKTGGAGRA